MCRANRALAWTGCISNIVKRCSGALESWCKRHTARANLCNLSDIQLMDIGITRGEVDYVVLNPSIDPRGGTHHPDQSDRSWRGHC
jgi:uncharacterized protein YjiS (DUF1127 family)